jgi:hypothetical protein
VPTCLFEVSICLIGVPNCPGADLSWYRNVSHRFRSVLVPICPGAKVSSIHSYTLPAMSRMNVPVLQIILVRLVLLTILYECDFSEFGTQYSCNVFPSQSRNWNRNNMLKKTKNTPFNGYSLQGPRVQHFVCFGIYPQKIM